MIGFVLCSFRNRLLLGMLLSILLIQSFAIGHEMLDHHEAFMTALKRECALVLTLTSEALAQPLRDQDSSQIARILASVISEGHTTRVQLFDPSGTSLLLREAPGYIPAADDLQASQVITSQIGGALQELGRLEITLSTAGVAAPLWEALMHHLMASLIVLALIGLLTFLVLSRLSRPLTQISTAMNDIRHDRFSS
jgi:hypothetical protein